MNKTLYPNTFQHHNAYVDQVSFFLTGNEEKVLNHVIREIIGFKSNAATRMANIALSVLVKGKFRKGTEERLSWGCGLKDGAVRNALAKLVEFGLIERVGTPTHAGQCYKLQLEWDRINWEAMETRKAEKDATYRAQMQNARDVNPLLLNRTPPVEQNPPPPVEQNPPPPVEQGTKNPSKTQEETHTPADAGSELDNLFPRETSPQEASPALPEKFDLTTEAGRRAAQDHLHESRRAKLLGEPWLTYDTAHQYREYRPKGGGELVEANALRRVYWLLATKTGLQCHGSGWSGWRKGLADIYLEGMGKWDVIERVIGEVWGREHKYRPNHPNGFPGEIRKALAVTRQPTAQQQNSGWQIPGGSSE